jgi:hypothetical protein
MKTENAGKAIPLNLFQVELGLRTQKNVKSIVNLVYSLLNFVVKKAIFMRS